MISSLIENHLNFGRSDFLAKALYRRPESASKLIPYLEAIEDSSIIVLNDLSLGVVYELKPLPHEVMSKEEILRAVARLKPLVDFDKNFVVGISYCQERDLDWDQRLQAHSEAYNGHPTSMFLYNEKIKSLKAKPILKRSVRFWIRYFPRAALRSKLQNRLGKALFNEIKDYHLLKSEFDLKLKSLETSLEIPFQRMTVDQVIEIARDYFAVPGKRPIFGPLNPERPLSKQIVRSEIRVLYQSITVNDNDFRSIMTGVERPRLNYPGLMTHLLEIDQPFSLTLNLSFPTSLKSKKEFSFKTFCLEKAPGALARMMKEDIEIAEEKIQRGDAIIYMTPIITTRARTKEELEAINNQVCEVFTKQIGMPLAHEKEIGFGLGLNSLPLFHTPLADASSERYFRIHQSDALQFLPVFGTNPGLTEPLSLYRSRENGLIRFNLFENETSNHSVVLADTGSGKSAFIIDCVQSVKKLKTDPLIFVIDRKSSYLMLSQYFNADLTVFDPNGKLPFSPFRGVYDNAKISFLTHLIKTAVTLSSPSFQFEGEHISVVSDSLKLAYLRKLEVSRVEIKAGEIILSDQAKCCELSMEDVIEAMAELPAQKGERLEPITEALISKLAPFYGDGIYAKYFEPLDQSDASRQIQTTSFFIYDLDALASDPLLQTLMTMAVVEEIRCQIKANPGRGGLLIFEEIGMLGKDNKTAESFIIEAAETFRKLGVWLVGLTPRPQNYFEIPAAKALWAAADNFIFLQMSADNVSYLKNHSDLISDCDAQIIESLRTVRSSHADIYYMNKKKDLSGTFKYEQSAFDQWLSPTNAKSLKAAQQALKKTKDPWSALNFLVEKYPGGL